MEPRWETAGQGLMQSVLLPWEQAFYSGGPETVYALRKRQEEGEQAFYYVSPQNNCYMYLWNCHGLGLTDMTPALKLSPLAPGLTTPTAELDVYPVREPVPCCFPLARDMCVGGAVGRLKMLVGWLSC